MASSPTIDTGFFANATKTLDAMLTPFGATALQYSNGSQLGDKAKDAYVSQVTAAQTNGAGPAGDPINAPWSFDEFALGRRGRAVSAARPRARRFPWLMLALVIIVAWLAWRAFKRG